MKKRILIIEDDEKNMVLERELLEVAGFEVLVAKDAKTGIAIATKEIPDALVMDVRLPDMRGTEVVQILLRDKKTSGIPIIFVTASVVGEDAEEMKIMSKCGFISKPIDTRIFAKKIGKCTK